MDSKDKERENTQEAIVAVIESKLDQLIQSVKDIKQAMHDNSVDIADLKLKVNTYENKTEQQQREIDKINEKNEANVKWIMGIVSGLVIAGVCGIVHLLIGI